MTKAAYWFRLTDYSESPLDGAVPRVWVEGPNGTFGPDGVLAPSRVPVEVTEGGACVVYLVPSPDLSPPAAYKVKCEWLTHFNNHEIPAGWGEWTFTALAGGGDIAEMVEAPPSIVIAGPPWPTTARPGIYFDRDTSNLWKVGL